MLRECIQPFFNFPKEGICYWDTSPVYQSPYLLQEAIEKFSAAIKSSGANCLGAIEAKGFPLGGALAYALKLPLVFIRKPGLTPGRVLENSFIKEYGRGSYQLKDKLLDKNKRVYLLYDILAGPGATFAAKKLIERTGANLVGVGYLVELEYLHGREELEPLPLLALVNISEPEKNEI